MNTKLKKINKNSFFFVNELYNDLIKEEPKIRKSFLLKKKLCSYNNVTIFYFQRYFLNFLTEKEIVSKNFFEFKKIYSYKDYHKFANLSLINTQQEQFFQSMECLENLWVIFALSYLEGQSLKIPLLYKFQEMDENFQTIENKLYEIHCLENKNQNIKKYFKEICDCFNQNIDFLMESFFFRNELMKNCFSFLNYPTFFCDYFNLILSFDWALSNQMAHFDHYLYSYTNLYKRFYKNLKNE